jgi:hypothetical protein
MYELLVVQWQQEVSSISRSLLSFIFKSTPQALFYSICYYSVTNTCPSSCLLNHYKMILLLLFTVINGVRAAPFRPLSDRLNGWLENTRMMTAVWISLAVVDMMDFVVEGVHRVDHAIALIEHEQLQQLLGIRRMGDFTGLEGDDSDMETENSEEDLEEALDEDIEVVWNSTSVDYPHHAPAINTDADVADIRYEGDKRILRQDGGQHRGIETRGNETRLIQKGSKAKLFEQVCRLCPGIWISVEPQCPPLSNHQHKVNKLVRFHCFVTRKETSYLVLDAKSSKCWFLTIKAASLILCYKRNLKTFKPSQSLIYKYSYAR